MIDARDAMLFEHRIGPGIFLGKRIGGDPVMFQKGLNLHAIVTVKGYGTPWAVVVYASGVKMGIVRRLCECVRIQMLAQKTV